MADQGKLFAPSVSAKMRQRKLRRDHPELAKAAQDRYNRKYPRKRQWAHLLNAAKRRNIVVTISFDEFLLLRGEDKCFYCYGQLPMLGSGLDRLDNSKGYVSGNCVPCCKMHNKMKHDLSLREFVDQCKLIVARFQVLPGEGEESQSGRSKYDN